MNRSQRDTTHICMYFETRISYVPKSPDDSSSPPAGRTDVSFVDLSHLMFGTHPGSCLPRAYRPTKVHPSHVGCPEGPGAAIQPLKGTPAVKINQGSVNLASTLSQKMVAMGDSSLTPMAKKPHVTCYSADESGTKATPLNGDAAECACLC